MCFLHYVFFCVTHIVSGLYFELDQTYNMEVIAKIAKDSKLLSILTTSSNNNGVGSECATEFYNLTLFYNVIYGSRFCITCMHRLKKLWIKTRNSQIMIKRCSLMILLKLYAVGMQKFRLDSKG